jgi:RimJ/RimL family protein N-acetyltransferase
MTGEPAIRLRTVEDADLPILYEHQADPQAAAMAAYPSKSLTDFMAHWAAIRSDPTNITRAIEADGIVVGNILSWIDDDHRDVGYWIGREWWGRGYASRALALLLEEIAERPLFAHVVDANIGSQRVLERCGFVRAGSTEADGLLELLFRHD